CIEPSQPVVAPLRRTGLGDALGYYRAEYRAHRSRRDRIAYDHLAAPLGIEDVVPILRRAVTRNRVAVVRNYFRCEVGAIPQIMRIVRLRGNITRPGRAIRLKKVLLRGTLERLGRCAEPDVGLWIYCLATNAVENFLRAHVHPLNVDGWI